MVGELSRRPRQDPSIDRSMFARGIRIALGATTEIIRDLFLDRTCAYCCAPIGLAPSPMHLDV